METVQSFLTYHAIEGGRLSETIARKLVIDCLRDCMESDVAFFSDCQTIEQAQRLDFAALVQLANEESDNFIEL